VNATVRVKSDPSRSLSWKDACAKLGAMPMTVRGKNPDKSKPPDLTNSGVGGVQMADVFRRHGDRHRAREQDGRGAGLRAGVWM